LLALTFLFAPKSPLFHLHLTTSAPEPHERFPFPQSRFIRSQFLYPEIFSLISSSLTFPAVRNTEKIGWDPIDELARRANVWEVLEDEYVRAVMMNEVR
jgi:hypothetical protein